MAEQSNQPPSGEPAAPAAPAGSEAPAPAPAADPAAAAAADFGRTMLEEAGPLAGPTFDDPSATNQAEDIGAIFGLPPAGSQGGDEGAGGRGAPPPASAAGAGGEGQAQGTAPQGPSPSSSEPAGGTPQTPTQPGPAPAAPSPAAAPPSAAPAQPQGYDPARMELESLRAQVAQLQQRLQPPQPGGAPQPGAGAPPSGQPQADQAPQYGLQVPQEHVNMMQSDDPRQAQHAMSDMLNQALAHVHQRVVGEVQSLIQSHLQSFRTNLQAEQTTSSAVEDYYSNYPQHRQAAAIVTQEAAKLQQEFPGHPWNEQYRNALGSRVNTVLQSLGAPGAQPSVTAPAAPNGGAPAAPAPTPPVAHLPQQPAPFSPGGTRPAMDSTDPSQFMYETMTA